jgi:DNA-binding NarL/FixJ family response regulator
MSRSTQNSPRKTALVDDDPVYRGFLETLLSQLPEIELVKSWESAEELLADAKIQEVELLFVDLGLPGQGGLGLISKLNQMNNPPQCVVLTSSTDPEDVFAAIRNGACGYLIKSGDAKIFQESLKQIIHDGVSLSPSIARLLVQEFRQKAPAKPLVKKHQSVQSLTSREREVLNALAKLGNAKDVGRHLELSHETVRVHMKKIYQKLHVNSKVEALSLLAQDGLSQSGQMG